MNEHARLATALAFTSLAVGGCLPRGDAPVGRQILANPTASLVELVPPTGDGLLRVLFFRAGKDADVVDLWVLSVDANGDALTEQKLSADFPASDVVGYRPAAHSFPSRGLDFGPTFAGDDQAFITDARGRIYLAKTGGGSIYSTFRIDPVTGESRDLGDGFVSLSASGARVAVNSPTRAVLYEADDSTTTIDSEKSGFLGEDFYYLTAAGELMRSAPGGATQPLAADVGNFYSTGGQLLLLVRGGATSSVPGQSPFDPGADLPPGPDVPVTPVTAAILDTTTAQEMPLPAGLSYDPPFAWSSDTRWLLTSDQGQQVLIDRLSGAVERFDAPWYSAVWRPGHDELWGTALIPGGTGLDQSFVAIKKPGQPVVTVPQAYLTRFTPDGAYWISPGNPIDQTVSLDLIGPADAPTAPRRPLVPGGTSLVDLWQLDDGRLLVTSDTGPDDSFEENYAQVVDPGSGATDVAGQRGYVAAVGKSHMLGIFDVSYERGDLTSVDFATGKATVLASEFAMAAITESAAADRYPPNGRIVYQFRGRFSSPWDGLWLATAP